MFYFLCTVNWPKQNEKKALLLCFTYMNINILAVKGKVSSFGLKRMVVPYVNTASLYFVIFDTYIRFVQFIAGSQFL